MSAEESLQEDKGERKEKKEGDDTKEGATVGDEGADQKVESSDWPEERVCHTHERAIPIQETVEALDITEEGEQKREASKEYYCTHKLICTVRVF